MIKLKFSAILFKPMVIVGQPALDPDEHEPPNVFNVE